MFPDVEPSACPGSQPACNGRRTAEARAAAVGFEALLFESALKPLAKSMGFFGDIAAGAMARAIAAHDTGGLSQRIESLVEAASK